MDGQNVSGQSQHPAPQHRARRKDTSFKRLTIAIVVVIIGAALAIALLSMTQAATPKGDRYQAVFLNNGQVFFGKLKNTNGTYLKLEKAYYTQKQDLPSDATAEQKAATANNVSLVKVGDEVYGPEGNMNIRADQVLFWQDLKADSKVAKAIDSKS
jgi:hypothetical protein